LLECVATLLGRSLVSEMLPVDQEDAVSSIRLHGLLGQPTLNRSTSSHIYTFINGRYIRDRVVQHAIMNGYRHLLMKGRFPVVVLFIEIAADKVDVNVHPTKHEVRFREQSLIHDFISSTLQQQLKPAAWVQPAPEIVAAPISDEPVISSDVREESQAVLIREPCPPPYEPGGASSLAGAGKEDPAPLPSVAQTPGLSTLPDSTTQPAGQFFSGLRYLGQFHNSYLLCQDGDDLLLIDQHAAHERISFERLKKSFVQENVAQQRLLFPEMLELDFKSGQALEEHLYDLARLGFDVEPFGGKSYVLKAVPQLLADSDNKSLIVDIALELEQVGSGDGLEDKLDEVLILMACHSVIRANQALDPREARALLEQLDGVDFKANCPHGRPVMQRLHLHEIERMFRRQ
ncbi:MAG: DNA mismatch repair protein MutL, partial [Desulfuromusa sp.]|nr:DNA mismatch repair protein MutL [Desulfuromusa sp.]